MRVRCRLARGHSRLNIDGLNALTRLTTGKPKQPARSRYLMAPSTAPLMKNR